MGRKIFGPNATDDKPVTSKKIRNDLEEGLSSEDERVYDATAEAPTGSAVPAKTPQVTLSSSKTKQKLRGPSTKVQPHVDNILRAVQTNDAAVLDGSGSEDSESEARADVAPANTNGWTKVQLPSKPEAKTLSKPVEHTEASADVSDTENAEGEAPLILNRSELIKSAFGGDDVESDFEKEKRAAADSEDEKVIDNALPGWGSWAGEGISKREQKRAQARTKGKFLTKTEGVKPAARKDTKLDRVIVSERRIKKNAKYLASTLPHPFESRQQYERSLRLPIGPEWTTKETFQNATKPRVMVKQGIIKPMSTPML